MAFWLQLLLRTTSQQLLSHCCALVKIQLSVALSAHFVCVCVYVHVNVLLCAHKHIHAAKVDGVTLENSSSPGDSGVAWRGVVL